MLSGFSFGDTENSQNYREKGGPELFFSTISTCSPTFRHFFYAFNLDLLHLFAPHLFILLYSYSIKCIDLWKLEFDGMLTSFHLLILCQILLQQFSINKWEIWTFINHFPVTINEMTNQVSLLPSYNPHLQLKIEAISNISNVLYFDSLKQTFFRIDSRM